MIRHPFVASAASVTCRAFTIVELLAVISVIAILLSMGMAGLSMAMRRASQQSSVNIIGAAHSFCYEAARGQYASEGAAKLTIDTAAVTASVGGVEVTPVEIGKNLRHPVNSNALTLAADYLPTKLLRCVVNADGTVTRTARSFPETLTYANKTGFNLDPKTMLELELRQGGNPQAPGYRLTFFPTGLMKVSAL